MKVNRNPRTGFLTHDFYRDPAFKKKISDSQKKSRAKRTPEQRELHNAKIALAYRRSHAENLFNLNTYSGRRNAKKWIAVAEERLKKAEAA